MIDSFELWAIVLICVGFVALVVLVAVLGLRLRRRRRQPKRFERRPNVAHRPRPRALPPWLPRRKSGAFPGELSCGRPICPIPDWQPAFCSVVCRWYVWDRVTRPSTKEEDLEKLIRDGAVEVRQPKHTVSVAAPKITKLKRRARKAGKR